nr:acyltransferase domain-containing protein [Streptacidiphilus melanogenes]
MAWWRRPRTPWPGRRPEWTQPCVFAVEYALAATLAELGVRPDGVVGHSIGEFAAVAAEALTLDEAAAVVAARATAMGALPEGGGMLAVRADAEQLAELVAARGRREAEDRPRPEACPAEPDRAAWRGARCRGPGRIRQAGPVACSCSGAGAGGRLPPTLGGSSVVSQGR